MNLLRLNALVRANEEATGPFDMMNWDCCLLGNYINRPDLQKEIKNTGYGIIVAGAQIPSPCTWAAGHFGISVAESFGLFSGVGRMSRFQNDKEGALNCLREFIQEKLLSERPLEEPLEPEEDDEDEDEWNDEDEDSDDHLGEPLEGEAERFDRLVRPRAAQWVRGVTAARVVILREV